MQSSNLNKLHGLGGNPVHAKISKEDWNFDGPRVDDDELMTCCVWEYARESNSIREAVTTAKTFFANQGIPRPETPEREAFRAAADKAFGLLHETGFGGDNIIFWTGLGFPKPWQQVDAAKRKEWARVSPEIPTPVKFWPFQVTGDLIIAGVLRRQANYAHELRAKLYSEIYDDATDSAKSAELRKTLSATLTPLVERGPGGVDSFYCADQLVLYGQRNQRAVLQVD